MVEEIVEFLFEVLTYLLFVIFSELLDQERIGGGLFLLGQFETYLIIGLLPPYYVLLDILQVKQRTVTAYADTLLGLHHQQNNVALLLVESAALSHELIPPLEQGIKKFLFVQLKEKTFQVVGPVHQHTVHVRHEHDGLLVKTLGQNLKRLLLEELVAF